jgi:Tfp pilus assembly protein PilF
VTLRLHKVMILRRSDKHKAGIDECRSMLAELSNARYIRAVRLEMSQVLLDMRDATKSEEQLRLLLEADPNDALACNNLGYQLADRNQNLGEAEQLIRKAIDIDKLTRRLSGDEDGANAAYLDSLGWVLFRRGKLDEALPYLEKAAALPEGAEDATVWDHLGDVYLRRKEPAKAKQAWEAALKLFEHGRRSKKDGRLDEVRRKLKLVQGSGER